MPKSKYTPELFDSICETLATSSKGLHKICKENGLSPRTFYEWIEADTELAHRYTRAREVQADLLADEIVQISDDSTGDTTVDHFGNEIENREFVSRSRLRIDARKWVAAKLKPKKYSERMDVTSNGEAIKQVDLSALVAGFMKDAGDKETT